MTQDPTRRFSDRVEDYARYRPAYPPGVVEVLERDCGLAPGATVADVASGTGLLSRPLLERGYPVLGVEPNDGMRAAAERALAGYARFRSVAGTAERTGLGEGSADLVVVGNALHWVDPAATRREFRRILVPDGQAAVVWSSARTEGTPFLVALADLLRRYMEADGVTDRMEDLYRRTEGFFGGECRMVRMSSHQTLDLASLRGLVLSYSSVPGRGEPGSERMLSELDGIFRAEGAGGPVTVEYEVRVYCGRPA